MGKTEEILAQIKPVKAPQGMLASLKERIPVQVIQMAPRNWILAIAAVLIVALGINLLALSSSNSSITGELNSDAQTVFSPLTFDNQIYHD